MKKIMTIVGARPQFIKLAPLCQKLDQSFQHIIVHTGQHFDDNMSDIFFKEMNIRKPNIKLNINGGAHGLQTGQMLIKLEEVYLNEKPDLIIVFGDTNSTIAGALAASKHHIPIMHIEAGLRSFDKKMPEEVNRICTDHISTILSAPTQTSVKNLKNEGLNQNVYFHGDIMLDAQNHFFKLIKTSKRPSLTEQIKLMPNEFALLTLHRPSNTDNKTVLDDILNTVSTLDIPILFPIHPRTKKKITEFNIELPKNFKCIEPVGYLDMISLLTNTKVVLTDSGGLQKEAFFVKAPCITLRDTTEWVETIQVGANRLVMKSPMQIDKSMFNNSVNNIDDYTFEGSPFGDGYAVDKIMSAIFSLF